MKPLFGLCDDILSGFSPASTSYNQTDLDNDKAQVTMTLDTVRPLIQKCSTLYLVTYTGSHGLTL